MSYGPLSREEMDRLFKPMPIDRIPTEEIKNLAQAIVVLQPGNMLMDVFIDGVSPMSGQNHASVQTVHGPVGVKWDNKAGLQRKLTKMRAQRDELAKECIRLAEQLESGI